MSVFNLSTWVRRTPHPSAVIVRDGEGKDQRVEVGKDGRAWKNLTNTLNGMAPYVRLTLLDGQGSVIRAKSFAEDVSEEAEPDEEETATKSIASEDARLVVFARLLTDTTQKQPILAHAMNFISEQAIALTRANAECEKLRADNNRLRLQIGQLQLTPTDEAPEDGGVMNLLTVMARGAEAGRMVRPQGPRVVPSGKGESK